MGVRRVHYLLASATLSVSLLAATAGSAVTYAGSQPTLVIQENGTLQQNFNPLAVTALPGTFGLVYEPMFYFNTVGPQTYPLLGTKYAWSNGGKVLTVNLRKNVKWSDGQPFSADDVAFTFNLKKQWPATDGFKLWSQLKSVTAVNPYEVQFTFARVNVTFLPYILQSTPILPKHIWSNMNGDPTKTINDNPVGTGPYTEKSFSQAAYFFQANPHYWGGKPKVETIEYPSLVGGDAVAMAMAAGQIDWGNGFVANIDKVYVAKDPANRSYWFPPAAPIMLYTNNSDPLLGQVAVRRAISTALNRTQYANVAEYGYEKPASPSGLLLPNFNSWKDPKLPKADIDFTYDPKAAQKILDNAGFKKDSAGIYESSDGKQLTFDLNVVAGWPDWDEMASMIQQNLSDIGIKVNVHQMQVADWAAALRGHKFQMAIGGGMSGQNPYYFFRGLMDPSVGTNYEKWVDGGSKLALDKFAHSTNANVQKQAIYQLERIMADNLPSIPLVDGAIWSESNSKNFVGWPSAKNPYADPAAYDFPAEEIVVLHLKPAH